MEQLNGTNGLQVRQRKEMLEVFTGFETKNKYEVQDLSGARLYFAGEESGFISRYLLASLRPFTIHLADNEGREVMRIHRPFRFYFHRVEITDASGKLLGVVVRRFSFLRRIYEVEDPTCQPILELFGPILHPWTFNIRRRGEEIGKITKKWSGIAKEAFTDADNFGVTWPEDIDATERALLLGAVFLIDFVHFERKSND